MYLTQTVPHIDNVSNGAGIPCDVSVGSSNSRFKAEVVKALVRLDGRFEQMLRVIKVWSGAHGLNDASNGTFNTFALSLMVWPPDLSLQAQRPWSCHYSHNIHAVRTPLLWS